jgi:hypothetical protein
MPKNKPTFRICTVECNSKKHTVRLVDGVIRTDCNKEEIKLALLASDLGGKVGGCAGVVRTIRDRKTENPAFSAATVKKLEELFGRGELRRDERHRLIGPRDYLADLRERLATWKKTLTPESCLIQSDGLVMDMERAEKLGLPHNVRLSTYLRSTATAVLKRTKVGSNSPETQRQIFIVSNTFPVQREYVYHGHLILGLLPRSLFDFAASRRYAEPVKLDAYWLRVVDLDAVAEAIKNGARPAMVLDLNDADAKPVLVDLNAKTWTPICQKK